MTEAPEQGLCSCAQPDRISMSVGTAKGTSPSLIGETIGGCPVFFKICRPSRDSINLTKLSAAFTFLAVPGMVTTLRIFSLRFTFAGKKRSPLYQRPSPRREVYDAGMALPLSTARNTSGTVFSSAAPSMIFCDNSGLPSAAAALLMKLIVRLVAMSFFTGHPCPHRSWQDRSSVSRRAGCPSRL